MLARESWKNVGKNIRTLRKLHRLTLRQLSAGSGLSPNAISLVERGQVAPTVETLCRIATALGAPASTFLQNACPNEVTLIRAHDTLAASPTEMLVEAVSGQSLKYKPHHCAPTDTQIEGETCPPANTQMLLCLSGQMTYEGNEGQVYLLGQGDRLSCNGNAPQRWRNPGNEPALAILVLSPQGDDEGG